MRTLYDAVNVSAIPADATMVAGYVDGNYQTLPALRARFPHAQVVTITVFGAPGANVADCEQGDLTPAEAAQWARVEKQAGRHPTIYCSASPWPTVKRECQVAGLDPDTDVSWWIAQYDNDPTIPAGAVAKQYRSTDVDVSSVAAHWPGVDPAPKPTPKPSEPSGYPHGKPPEGLASPVWWSDPNDGHAAGWRDVHNVPSGTFHVFSPRGQRLAYWSGHGWSDPHSIPARSTVVGWTWTPSGWQPNA